MKVVGITAAFCLIFSTSAFAQGNAAEGAKKKSMCEGCHGIPGYRTAYPEVFSAPKLGGQDAGYIVKALKGYQSGTREHPTMTAIAASLSEQDMADLAAYYSQTNATASVDPK